MNNLKHKIAFVVATKDRPSELRCMLKSLEAQTKVPDQIIIVDGSKSPDIEIGKEFSSLQIKTMHCIPPSASKQRNMGISAVDLEMDLIGFLDDDVELKTESVKAMIQFWENAAKEVAGAAFNMANCPPLFVAKLKSFPIVEKLGIYSKKKGMVLPSGFQTMIGSTSESIFVEWLPSGAVVWKKEIFDKFQFDEWFSGYSYLEDLDFSYAVGKKYRLVVVADAGYYHYPASCGRGSGYEFGVREVLNRIRFVNKHRELSLFKCIIALKVRQIISLWLFFKEKRFYFLARAWGNVVGFLKAMLQNK